MRVARATSPPPKPTRKRGRPVQPDPALPLTVRVAGDLQKRLRVEADRCADDMSHVVRQALDLRLALAEVYDRVEDAAEAEGETLEQFMRRAIEARLRFIDKRNTERTYDKKSTPPDLLVG
jgi:hypothetical protein